MLALISPAKSLRINFHSQFECTTPKFPAESKELVGLLQVLSKPDLKRLMNLSDKLAELNYLRYQNWFSEHGEAAILMFQGDVYKGLMAEELNAEQMGYCQQHVRVLSGLYGILRPLDAIRPYRLEMGTRLANTGGENLYDFWRHKVTQEINQLLVNEQVLINLASNEYFKAVDKVSIKGKIVDVVFLDYKGGQYKMISFYAKKARGLMVRYMIDQQISKVDQLQGFDYQGYYFYEQDSSEQHLVFRRDSTS